MGHAAAISADPLFRRLDDWITKINLSDFIVPHPLADGDRRFHPDQPIDNGEKQFARKCSVCHSLTPSSKRRAGPTLFGVFGRKVGAVVDYPYSKELIAMDLVWNERPLIDYLKTALMSSHRLENAGTTDQR